jgi:L-alanine-DL-glutamate epimerase-like enolase superfamily enzyme
MKIARIEISHHRLPLDPPFRAAWDTRPRTAFQATVVRVATDEGVTGIGSGDLMLGFAGHEHLFIGRDPLDLERHNKVIDNLSFHYGRCWPLDLALWDLAGKIKGEPCWRLLGGTSDRVRAYASSGTLRAPEAMAEAAQRWLDAGFAALKIRFHRPDWRDDLAVVAAVRRAVGDRLALMVDCNQGWRMPWDTAEPWRLDRAAEVAAALAELDVYWMEEPLHRADYAGMAGLRKRAKVRIAGGELNRELHEYRTLLERDCLDVYQPDATLVGGITGLAKLGREIASRGLAFSPHTWSDGLGVVANAQLAAAIGAAPYLEFPFDPPEWTLDRRDFILAEPIRLDADGWFALSERPGFGVALDEGRLARTRI